MKTVSHIEKLEFLKREDGVSFYWYRVVFSDGSIMEGKDYISAYRNIDKARSALIGLLNDMLSDLD